MSVSENTSSTTIVVVPPVFITTDMSIRNFDVENIYEYDLTCKLDFPDFDADQYDYEPSDEYPDFKSWALENISREEVFELPMMNAIWCYPSFVDFDESDRLKTSGSTTLFYDMTYECWCVGLTGGGMDLGPHLLETFIKLGKGIPVQLISGLRQNYPAYVDADVHKEYCALVNEAITNFSSGLRIQ